MHWQPGRVGFDDSFLTIFFAFLLLKKKRQRRRHLMCIINICVQTAAMHQLEVTPYSCDIATIEVDDNILYSHRRRTTM